MVVGKAIHASACQRVLISKASLEPCWKTGAGPGCVSRGGENHKVAVIDAMITVRHIRSVGIESNQPFRSVDYRKEVYGKCGKLYVNQLRT